ncbi:MAG: type II toxin-antitoxin system YoeB family toxin [Streptosporangiaceae bacterium]
MKVIFSDDGWEDYLSWQARDRKILRRITQLSGRPVGQPTAPPR